MLTRFPLKFPKVPLSGPVGGPIVDIIIEGAKKLWDKFTNSEFGEEISEKDKFNEGNIADVIDYSKLLNDFTKEIEDDIYKMEEKIVVECTEYYEELILLVETVEQSKNINLQSRFIKRSIEKIKKDTKGNLAKSIHRQISLDNNELKKILSLPAGELKKVRIHGFKENLIKQVLSDFVSEVKVSIEDFSDDVSDEVNGVISDITRNNEILLEKFTLLENSKENDVESIKTLIESTETKTLLYEEILNVIKE